MGYTSVGDRSAAVAAARRLIAVAPPAGGEPAATVAALLPQLVDQVAAEAGVWDERACARAVVQARGDVARAVSLVRAWAATLTRLDGPDVDVAALRVLRRITPGLADPPGGQFLGGSMDYAQRLLDLGGADAVDDEADGHGDGDGDRRSDGDGGPATGGSTPAAEAEPIAAPPRAAAPLEAEGLLAPVSPRAVAVDITREATPPDVSRAAFLQLLSRAETGAMTAMAYVAIRGYGQRQDPTILELRAGGLPVSVTHPATGEPVVVGEVPLTLVELVHFRSHDGLSDQRLTLGTGVTVGRVERRAIAAAMLDAGCAHGQAGSHDQLGVTENREFLGIALDGQEATGFIEHLKLPHHVTFQSDLDVVRAASDAAAAALDDAMPASVEGALGAAEGGAAAEVVTAGVAR